ncbi:hypothetical protein [Streptomyces hygroscopicus]|uniref:hypothetical protein n=1 Tax=Streptomyces hygroscopicus TaxID=1912 RepID=UPI0037AB7B3E
MAALPPAVVYPPVPSGGRRVTTRGEIVGLAHGREDVAEFLRRTGLDENVVALNDPGLIEWRGGGPDAW